MQMVSNDFDAIVIGAGFSGLYMLYRLRECGLAVRVFEKGDGVGGTWYWNRYPGARCDSESMYYSYSFDPELEQEWHWTERYPGQPEILSYLNHVADRYDLRKDIQFETTVKSVIYDEARNHWIVRTDNGTAVTTKYCITAVGCLSDANRPRFKGEESFGGAIYHTGHWPHESVDLAGKRVGIVGTGASGIQAIPVLAEQAMHLTVFQRTPNFTIPAENRPLDPEFERQWKANYRAWRQKGRESAAGIPYTASEKPAVEASPEERAQAYEAAWGAGGFIFLFGTFGDLLVNEEANKTAADFVRAKIDAIVRDRAVADMLKPTTYPLGTKRLPLDTDYYKTFNRPNVTLVDLRRTPIEELVPAGIRTTDSMFDLDVIVFATGFDAITGALYALNIEGRGGARLNDAWSEGPRTYLGLLVAGFPNLFTITGPGSPSVLSNMPVSIEQHVEWIADCIRHLEAHGIATIEARQDAQAAWTAHVNEVAHTTLFPRAASWYMGANIPGKPRIFMPYIGGVGNYARKIQEVAANGYEGFALDGAVLPPADARQAVL
jgi:cyclohexanone monooxygenase